MADTIINIEMRQRNANNDGWIIEHPVTKATNVVAADGTTTFESHLAESPTKTTANINYYVDATNGSDTNNGLTSGTAFKTIQHAINNLPQIINHTVTIIVAVGTYSEDILITGFNGSGKITISGATSTTTTHNINSIYIVQCTICLEIDGFNLLTTTKHSIQIKDAFHVIFSHINITAVASSFVGFLIIATSCCSICVSTISNRSNAILANYSIVESGSNSGSGNTVCLYSTGCSHIIKSGTQPGGTTAETTAEGGAIVS